MKKTSGRLDASGRAILLFAATAVGLTLLGQVLQEQIVTALMPVFRGWLDFVDGTFRTVDLSLAVEHGESVVRRLATPKFAHVVGATVVYPGALLSNEMAAGMVLQPIILAAAALVAWPWRTAPEMAVRVVAGALLTLLVVLFDVPMMLYGFAWFEEVQRLDPDRISLLISWADAMNAGGRFVITAIAVIASIALGSAVGKKRPASSSVFD
jgi:hypothetical protein